MKYRKKPIEVEAREFEIKNWLNNHKAWPEVKIGGTEMSTKLYIETLEGEMEVTDGDFIVTGVNGEKYPVKPTIFWKTYDRIP